MIAWFVKNPIAANMLMMIIAVAGFYGIKHLNNEMFPSITPSSVEVTVPYPGAGSLEVEEQICIRIEEAIADIQGIKEIRSSARQGLGRVVVEAVSGWDTQRLLTDIKSRVDAINTFPADSEKAVVSEVYMRAQILNLAIYGNFDQSYLKDLAEEIKQDISTLPGVGRVTISGARDTEFGIEISAHTLREHGLGFDDVAKAIRGASINLPAGQVRNEHGDIQIQTYGQAYSVDDFARIGVITRTNGSVVRLGDLSRITQGFSEQNNYTFFNRKPTLNLLVYATEQPDFVGVNDVVNAYVETKQQTLPQGVELDIWFNFATYLKSRLDVMSTNALQGLVLVFILLMLFLRPILAFWVVVGLAVAYLGTFAAMSMVGTALTVSSSFAFILILGIVVDDAIVVSESIYAQYEKTGDAPSSAVLGTRQVAKPVTIAVLTTMMVFLPMLLATNSMAEFFAPMSVVAISALFFSLIESFYILPSHLSRMRAEGTPKNLLSRKLKQLRNGFSAWFERQVIGRYELLLAQCLQHRRLTVATFSVGFAIVISLFLGGWVKIHLQPDVQSERVTAYVTLKDGVGLKRSREVKDQLMDAVDTMQARESLVNDQGVAVIENVMSWIDGNQVRVQLGLLPSEQRDVQASDVSAFWRNYIGELKNIEDFNMITSQVQRAGEKDINLELKGTDTVALEQVTEQLKRLISNFDGVLDVSDSQQSASREIRISLKPYAETLGVDLADVARQVRYAFYGLEVQRIPELREDVKVLIRYPAEQRQNIEALESMWIKTDKGTEVPFTVVATLDYQNGYSEIQRVDRKRVVEIKANIDQKTANANEIIQQVIKHYWPDISKSYPGLSLELAGTQKTEAEFSNEMEVGFVLVMLAIYTLLAVEFKSYAQPLVILSAIPFGLAGGIVGHFLLGYPISMLSVFGFMATSGVVVNDNLVLLDRINSFRDQGLELSEAIKRAGRDRLRPIVLTSLTTFFGLVPILTSQVTSSKFLKPMVTSLSFGVLLASSVTVLLVPVLYSLLEDFKMRRGMKHRAEIEIDSGL